MHGLTARHSGSWSASSRRQPAAFTAPGGPTNVATGAAKRSERNPWQRTPRFCLSPRGGAMEACDEQVRVPFEHRALEKVSRLARPFGAVISLRPADHGFRSPSCASARCTRGYIRTPRRGESRARRGVHEGCNSSAALDVAVPQTWTTPSGQARLDPLHVRHSQAKRQAMPREQVTASINDPRVARDAHSRRLPGSKSPQRSPAAADLPL